MMPHDAAKHEVHISSAALSPSDRSATSFRDLVGLIRRRKGIILSSVLTITALTAYIVAQLSPQYTATAAVLISPRQTRIIYSELAASQSPLDRAMAVENELKILASRSNAGQVVTQLNLTSDPEFNPLLQSPDVPDPPLSRLAELPYFLLVATGLAGQRPPQPSFDHERQFEETTSMFLNALDIRPSGASYVISISFSSSDPKKAARIATKVAGFYVEAEIQEKIATTSQAGDLLAKRADDLRRSVIDLKALSKNTAPSMTL